MAKHKKAGTFVAIKRLKKVEVLRLKQVEHVLSEKAILLEGNGGSGVALRLASHSPHSSPVTHPHIVNLWATFQDNSSLYMVMEFVQGGEVFSHLRRLGRFSTDIARGAGHRLFSLLSRALTPLSVYAAEVCLALAFLHERDIVYRDLKPENLLLNANGHIKITDFGFAKRVKDKTWTVRPPLSLACALFRHPPPPPQLCGTPEYLCPEIIQSKVSALRAAVSAALTFPQTTGPFL